MTLSSTTERFIDYVRVAVTGPSSMKGFVDLVQALEEETLSWADTRVLVDLRGVEGRLDAGEQVFLGELVAQSLGHLERVASLVRPEDITRKSETAAQTMGMQLCVFTDAEEAINWLKAGADSPNSDWGVSGPMALP